jgi:hypothetical protein
MAGANIDYVAMAQQTRPLSGTDYVAARPLLGNKAASAYGSSLVPSVQSTAKAANLADLLPARPEYTPYVKQEFDPTVPMSDRPAGTENWMWSKSTAQREAFEQAEQAKADERYRQYQTDLAGWTDAVKLAQYEQEQETQRQQQELASINAQLAAAGLNPLASLSELPSLRIRQYQDEYNKAKAAGDYVAMNNWHAKAEAERQNAGWGSGGIDGSLTAGLMSLAGTPTAETQHKTDVLNYQKQQDANDYAVALAKASSGGGGSSSSSGGGGNNASGANPFGNSESPAKEKISGYAVSRIDSYINNLAGQMNNDPNKILQYVQNTKGLNSDFQQAVIARLYQRAKQ